MWSRVGYLAPIALMLLGASCTEPSIRCCDDDDDCDDAATCFEGTCAPRCFAASDCLGEQICTPSGACVFDERPDSVCPFDPPIPPACEDDAFEENDREEDAARLEPSADLTLCPGDRDAFFVDIEGPASGALVAREDAELELELVAPDGDRISLLTVAGRASFNIGEPAGRYLLVIRGASGIDDEGARYTIEIDEGPPPQCQQFDPNEPNDVVGGVIGNESFIDGVVCDDDLDRFTIPVLEDALIFIEISHNSPNGIDAELQRLPDGNALQANAEPFFSFFEFRSVADGELELRIRSIDGEENRYFLNVFIEGGIEPPDECFDDLFEPNDDAASATPLDLPILTAASLCEADRDIYEFFAEQDVSLRLRIEHNHPEGLFVRVRRGQGEGAVADTGPGFASLNFRSAADGPLLVDIESFDGAPVDYVLRLFEEDGPRTNPVFPGDCGFDENEPNNAPDDATGLNGFATGEVCATDIDLFAIGGLVGIELFSDGAVFATLLDPDGRPITSFTVDSFVEPFFNDDAAFLLITSTEIVEYGVFE